MGGKKREKEGPPGPREDEMLLEISLFTIYYSYFSLNYTEQTHMAIKQKGTKGPKEDKLIPDLWIENAITIRGNQHIAHVINDHFIDKTGNKSKNKEGKQQGCGCSVEDLIHKGILWRALLIHSPGGITVSL